MVSCAVAGCTRKHKGHGYCEPHLRQKKRGEVPGIIEHRSSENRYERDGAVVFIILTDRKGNEIARTQINSADLERVRSIHWSLRATPYTYAMGFTKRVNGKRHRFYLHRLLLDAPEGVEVDHINGDRLDNRRSNLRIVTRKQNAQNIDRQRGAMRGVYYSKKDNRWFASVKVNGVSTSVTVCGPQDGVKEAKNLRNVLMTHNNEKRHV